MTKQTVSEQFREKLWIYTAISEAVCLLNSPLVEMSDDLSNYLCPTELTPFERSCVCIYYVVRKRTSLPISRYSSVGRA